MSAKATSEQTIAVAHLHHIARTYVAHGKDTCHAFRPHIEVSLCVGANNRLTRRAAGSMDATDLIHRHCLQAEGIFVTKVVLGSKRKLGNVVNRLDVLRLHAEFIHLPLVERNGLVASFHCCHKAFALQLSHVLAGHAFHLGIVNHMLSYIKSEKAKRFIFLPLRQHHML